MRPLGEGHPVAGFYRDLQAVRGLYRAAWREWVIWVLEYGQP